MPLFPSPKQDGVDPLTLDAHHNDSINMKRAYEITCIILIATYHFGKFKVYLHLFREEVSKDAVPCSLDAAKPVKNRIHQ